MKSYRHPRICRVRYIRGTGSQKPSPGVHIPAKGKYFTHDCWVRIRSREWGVDLYLCLDSRVERYKRIRQMNMEDGQYHLFFHFQVFSHHGIKETKAVHDSTAARTGYRGWDSSEETLGRHQEIFGILGKSQGVLYTFLQIEGVRCSWSSTVTFSRVLLCLW